MKKLFLFLILLLCTIPVYAQFGGNSGPFPANLIIRNAGEDIEGSGRILDLRMNLSATYDSLTSTYHLVGVTASSIATFPSSPATGTLAVATDGDSATDCSTGGGSTFTICTWDGDSWESVGGGGGADISDKYIVVTTFTCAGVNTAIDALGSEGGEVYLPEGTYVCTDTAIVIDYANTTLTGSGAGTILDWSAGQDCTTGCIDTNAMDYVTIQNMTLLGTNGGDLEAFISDGDDCDYLTVQNCWFINADNDIMYSAGEYTRIINNHFEGCAAGLSLEGNWTIVDGNIFVSTVGNVISMGGYNAVVSNNQITGGLRGVNLTNDYGLAVGNMIELMTRGGIYVPVGGTYSTVVGNVVRATSNGYEDILVIADYVVVADNVLLGGTTADRGIHLDDSNYSLVTGNISNTHDVAGIQEDSDCVGNLIYGNNIQDATPYDLQGATPAALNVARYMTLQGTVEGAGLLSIFEDSDDGTEKATFTVPALGGDTAYTLPNAIGGAGEQLTDAAGDGTLSWASAGVPGAGYWSQYDATLVPSTVGDAIETTGPLTASSITTEGGVTASSITASSLVLNNKAEPAITISMTNVTGTNNQTIDIVGGETLNAEEHLTFIRIKPDDIDPDGADTRIRGIAVNMSGISTAQSFDSLDGIRIVMPAYWTNTHALHISEGQIHQDFTAGSDAGALYTPQSIVNHVGSLDTNSEIHTIDISTTGGVPSGDVVAVGTHTYVAPIHQHIGSYTTPSQTEYAGEKTGGGNTWADGIDSTTNQVFVLNSDEIYIGDTSQFSEIEIDMHTAGTKTISPTFHYNTAADAWTQFYPSDETEGFQQDGLIHWTLGDISASWTNDGDPGVDDTSAGYWIKIIRTANPDPGTPIIADADFGTVTVYYWDENGALDVLSVAAIDENLAGELRVVGGVTANALIAATGSSLTTSLQVDALADCDFTGTDGSGIFECHAIASKSEVTPVTKDSLVTVDQSDSNALKKIDVFQFLEKEPCVAIENLAAADDDMFLGSTRKARTIESLWCHYNGTGTTVAEISLEDGAGNAMTHNVPVCTAIGTQPVPVSVTANNTLVPYEALMFDVDNSPDPETDEYLICVDWH